MMHKKQTTVAVVQDDPQDRQRHHALVRPWDEGEEFAEEVGFALAPLAHQESRDRGPRAAVEGLADAEPVGLRAALNVQGVERLLDDLAPGASEVKVDGRVPGRDGNLVAGAHVLEANACLVGGRNPVAEARDVVPAGPELSAAAPDGRAAVVVSGEPDPPGLGLGDRDPKHGLGPALAGEELSVHRADVLVLLEELKRTLEVLYVYRRTDGPLQAASDVALPKAPVRRDVDVGD